MAAGSAARQRLAAWRLGALCALGLMATAAGAATGQWTGWKLACETSRVPLGDESWRWMWIDGLTPATDEEVAVAALDDRASLLLLLRAGEEPRSLYLETRAGAGVEGLKAVVNGVELGQQQARRNWRILEFSIPPGTLIHGPNVVAIEVVRGDRKKVSEPVMLNRVSVEPAVHCARAEPVAVDPDTVNRMPPDSAIVVRRPWTPPTRLVVRLAGRWPGTALVAHCIHRSTATLAARLTGGESRRGAHAVPLAGDCEAGEGLVLRSEGPGWLELRHASLEPPATNAWRWLGVPLALGFVLVTVALAATTAPLGRHDAGGGRRARPVALTAAGSAATRILGSPLTWLIVLSWIAFFTALERGALTAQRVPDTVGYENLFIEGTDDTLAFSRTPGYPIFLYLSGWERWGIHKLAITHALFYGAGIVLFWFGLRAFVGSGWIALAAALPLFASPLLRIIRRVQPDFAGGAASLFVIALVLLIAARPRPRWLWCVLAAAVFCGYQIRPALVFLIAFVPVAAVVLRVASHGWRDPGLRRFAVAALLAGVGPFVLFSTWRWVRVGHFGLVSYGGFNVIGTTSPMLDEELVAELPEEHRQLAEAIVAEKRRAGLPVYEKGTPVEFWYQNYNRHVWSIAVPTARRLYEPDGPRELGLIEMNDRFTALSFAIIARRPGLYLDWMVRSFAEVTGRALREPTIKWPAGLLAILALLAWTGVRREARPRDPADRRRLSGLLALAFVAVGFYVTHLLLIIAVEEALERYYVATVFLIPCALGALVFEAARRSLANWGPAVRR